MNIPTKHCSQCGTSAAFTAQFCAQCGSHFAPLAPEPSSYLCEQCEAVLPGGSRFCPGCGQAFDEPVPVSSSAPSPGFRPQTPQSNPISVTLHQSQPVPVSVQFKVPAFSHAGGPKVNYGWIGESWRLFQQKPDVWVLSTLAQYLPFVLLYGAAILFGILGSGGHILTTPDSDPRASEGMSVGLSFGMIIAFIPAFVLNCRLNYATSMMANKQVRGESITFSDIFKSGPGIWPLFGLGVIWAILFLVSALLFYLPVLILVALTLPCAALAAEGVGPVEALQRSVTAMKNDWLNAAGLVLLFLLITLISAVPCGLGLLITYPMANLLGSLACRDMIGLPSVPDASLPASQSFVPSPATEPSAISESQPSTFPAQPVLSEIRANKIYTVVVGSVLAAAFLALGFGLLRLAHPQPAIPNVGTLTSPVSSGDVPMNAASSPFVVPTDDSPASAVQGNDTSRNDATEAPLAQSSDAPDSAPEISDNKHAAASTDDTLTAYAPPGSGLSDVPLSIDTLQNEVVTSDDLKRLSLRALSISHNSIYALHGYIFERPAIQAYFDAQSWYHSDPAFNASMLTSTEQQNGQTIRAAERANFDYGRHMFDEQGRPYEQEHSYERRDPLRETASPGSGLSDTPLDSNTLQNTVVTSQDLNDKSLAALSISYNTIYAVHGYVFKKATLQGLFNHAAWYHPNPAFRETDFTSKEQANLQTIRSYEHSRFGY